MFLVQSLMYFYHIVVLPLIYLRPPPREFPELPEPPIEPDLELGPILDELLGLLIDEPTERFTEGLEEELLPKDLVLRSTE